MLRHLQLNLPVRSLRNTKRALFLIGLVHYPNGARAEQLTLEQAQQIDEGFRIFTEETFEGNGRTCATCHVPEANYTISPDDITRLGTAERDLVLATNVPGLENPKMVKKLALFNIGPGDARGDAPVGAFRASMSIAALDLTSGNDSSTFPGPFGAQLGWSGDGTPQAGFHHGNADPDADGTIRAFANGAIAQHSTKSLARVAGTDFRFATGDELDALDAFQRWLGRRPTPSGRDAFAVAQMSFANADVEAGKSVFVSDRANCGFCHTDGGANFAAGVFFPPGFESNFNQHTGIESERSRLSGFLGVPLPADEGGFNTPPLPPFPPIPAALGAFNLQSIIEAPRKRVFFHNSAFSGDIESAIPFYFSPSFLTSPVVLAPQAFPNHCRTLDCLNAVTPGAIDKLGSFMRSLSAFYSARDCERLIEEALDRLSLGTAIELPLRHCEFALSDVARVLHGSRLRPRPYVDVRNKALVMLALLGPAERAANRGKTDGLERLLREMAALRRSIATTPELP